MRRQLLDWNLERIGTLNVGQTRVFKRIGSLGAIRVVSSITRIAFPDDQFAGWCAILAGSGAASMITEADTSERGGAQALQGISVGRGSTTAAVNAASLAKSSDYPRSFLARSRLHHQFQFLSTQKNTLKLEVKLGAKLNDAEATDSGVCVSVLSPAIGPAD